MDGAGGERPASRWHNLFVSLAYTWSHGLSNQSTINYFNPNEFYGNTLLNVPAGVYRQPDLCPTMAAARVRVERDRSRRMATFGHHHAPHRLFAHSGLSIPSQGNGARPNITGAALIGPKTAASGSTSRFYLAGRRLFWQRGNWNLQGPSLINFDLTLQKTFKIREGDGLEFRAEAFNVFNHTNFTTVSTNYGSGTFGAGYRGGRSENYGVRATPSLLRFG